MFCSVDVDCNNYSSRPKSNTHDSVIEKQQSGIGAGYNNNYNDRFNAPLKNGPMSTESCLRHCNELVQSNTRQVLLKSE